jgi:hypothetical protein
MRLIARNWREFQHYKDRNPPWIRLHRKLLDDKDFQRLPVASRALAPMLWLLASESIDGVIDADADDLAFRLRQPEAEIVEALKPLIEKRFFVVDSGVLAECLTLAVPESEAETEALQKQSQRQIPPVEPAPAPSQKRKSPKTPIPEDFGVSERVSKWAASKGFARLDEHLESFRRKSIAKGYVNVSWDDAFMEAIREDWAKLRGQHAAPAGERATASSSEADRTQQYLRSKDMTPEERAKAETARRMVMGSIKVISNKEAA